MAFNLWYNVRYNCTILCKKWTCEKSYMTVSNNNYGTGNVCMTGNVCIHVLLMWVTNAERKQTWMSYCKT